MSVKESIFGVTRQGEEVHSFTMENGNGMKAVVMEYGAILNELWVPDRDGRLQDVVWGYEQLQSYEEGNAPGFGSTIGRNANRIGDAEITVNGVTYALEKNDGKNNLHGGTPGYNKRMWKGEVTGENQVTFSLHSPDGDQGFPGNVEVKVSYTLSDENELMIAYTAVPDQDTVVNMTNHTYFNLEGAASASVLQHEVQIAADSFTPTTEDLIPTGAFAPVEGTPMDFRSWKVIGDEIDADYEPLTIAGGYDHNFVLTKEAGYQRVAGMRSSVTGICMDVSTDLPGMQFYTGNFIDQEQGGKYGRTYTRRSAACFESQVFPDAVHHAHFPTSVCQKGEVYRTRTGYRFFTE